MKLYKSAKDFESLFKEKYPDYEIIEFKNLSSKAIIKDNNGFLHEKLEATRFLTRPIGIQSVINKIEYVKFLLNKHFGNLKVLRYSGMKEPILVEDENGFQYTPQTYDLLKGCPVSIITCTEKEKLFIFKANLKHGNKFTYPNFVYKNGKQIIKINCPEHGEFSQRIESHLFGKGCKKCKHFAFSKESWLNRLENSIAFLYLLEMSSEEETFIKIGITSLSVEKRYKQLKEYKFKVIDLVKGDPSFIYDLEKKLLKDFKSEKYVPKILFQGYTECFKINIIEKYEQLKNKRSESD